MKKICSAIIEMMTIAVVMLTLAFAGGLLDDYIYDYDCKTKTVTVYPGDTIWGIANRELDNQNRWDSDRMVYEICARNGIANNQVSNLQPGTELIIYLYTKR